MVVGKSIKHLYMIFLLIIIISTHAYAQSHPPSEITGGNFSGYDFEFPMKLYVNQTVTIRSGDLDLSNNALLNVDWSTSDDGSGSSLDADTIENQNYNSNWQTTQSNIQSALSSDFHNIGGTDDDVPEAGDFGAATDLDSNGNVVDDSHNHIYSNIDATTSSNWAGRVTDETGTGSMVFSNSPSFTTPSLGAATATTINTGQGANELYDMNQNVLTTSAVTFSTVRADSGLYVNDDEYFYYWAEDVIRTDDTLWVTSDLTIDGLLQSPYAGEGSINLNPEGDSSLYGSLVIKDDLEITTSTGGASTVISDNINPASEPRINFAGATSITFEGSGYIIMDSDNDQTTTAFRIGRDSTTTTGQTILYVFSENGNLNTLVGGYQDSGSCVAGTCASDRRLKKDIEYLNGSLDKISRLKPANFGFYNESDGNPIENYGLIAQEVIDIYPEWVEEREDGYYALEYGLNIEMEMLEGIKELSIELDEDIIDIEKKQDLIKKEVCKISNNFEFCV